MAAWIATILAVSGWVTTALLLWRLMVARREVDRAAADVVAARFDRDKAQADLARERARCLVEQERASESLARHRALISELHAIAKQAPPEARLERLDKALARLGAG